MWERAFNPGTGDLPALTKGIREYVPEVVPYEYIHFIPLTWITISLSLGWYKSKAISLNEAEKRTLWLIGLVVWGFFKGKNSQYEQPGLERNIEGSKCIHKRQIVESVFECSWLSREPFCHPGIYVHNSKSSAKKTLTNSKHFTNTSPVRHWEI